MNRTLGEAIREGQKWARLNKEAEAEGGYPLDEIHEVHIYRDDMMFRLFPSHAPKGITNGHEHMYLLLEAGITGLKPEMVNVVSDACHMSGDRSLSFKRRLNESEFKGNMHKALLAGRGEEFGITETMLSMTAIPNNGSPLMFLCHQPYVFQNGELVWRERWMKELTDEREFQVRMPKEMIASFQLAESFNDAIADFDSDMEDDQRRFHLDMAALRVLYSRGASLALYTTNKAKQKTYEAHLADRFGDEQVYAGEIPPDADRAERRRYEREHNKRRRSRG